MKGPDDTLQIEVGHATDIGLVREHNEDAVLVQTLVIKGPHLSGQPTLCAVADGMGGHQAGEVASNLALEALASHLRQALSAVAVPERDTCAAALADGIHRANAAVFSQNASTNRDMGTTLVAALLMGETACIANVGDSRAYLMQGDQLRQLTTDHSLVAELVAAGKLAPDDIYTHPKRNIVTRSLGTWSNVRVDSFVSELGPGTALLLCSDGLWEMVRDSQLRDVLLRSRSAQEACDALVELANKNGGADNIAVVVAKVHERPH